MAVPPGSRTRCFRACQGSPSPPGLSTSRPTDANRVAFRVLGAVRHAVPRPVLLVLAFRHREDSDQRLRQGTLLRKFGNFVVPVLDGQRERHRAAEARRRAGIKAAPAAATAMTAVWP